MLICPDCTGGLDPAHDACPACGWRVGERSGIREYLSSGHRESPIVRHYIENYEEIARDDLTETMQGDDYLDNQAERIRSLLGEVRGLDVLDVGMGQGRLLDLVRRDGARVTGVDIVTPYMERFAGRDDVSVVVANAENLPFSEAFDMVIAADVLEHVLNLGDALLSIRRALKPGGTLIARVPYKENLLQYAHLGETGKYDMVHLRDFNEENLTRSLAFAGFEVGDASYEGFHAYRKRPWVTRRPRVDRAVDRFLVRRYGSLDRAYEIGPRAGRMLMVPVVITVKARRP